MAAAPSPAASPGTASSATLKRVGMFGGSFDPPHNAHVALVRAAVQQLQLDVLHVLPTGQAWHKTRKISAAAHRLTMAKLAFADCPHVEVDDRELRRTGPTYTIDTLSELRAELSDAQLYLVIGQDQASAFDTWRRAAEIAENAIISIAARADSSGPEAVFYPPEVLAGRFAMLHFPSMPVSATEIRRRVAAGEAIDSLVPKAVARYIAQHHLYQSA